MNAEQNESHIEVQSVNEAISEKEASAASEAIAEKESIGDEEDNRHARSLNNEETEEPDKKDSDSSDSSDTSGSSSAGGAGSAAGAAGAAGATVAVIAAVTIIISSAVSGITAAFQKLEAFGNYFDYILSVSMTYEETEDQIVDFDNTDLGLVMVVSKNGFSKSVRLATGGSGPSYTLEKIPIEDSETKYRINITFSGQVDGLEENTRYKLAVIGDEDGKTVTYVKGEIKTTARVSKVNGISSRCTCDKDGNFNFTVDYADENQFYSDFSYEFLNNAGEVVKSGVIDSPDTEQHIGGVDELPGKDYTLVVHFKSIAETDVQADNVTASYLDGAVNVLIDQGKITITAKVII